MKLRIASLSILVLVSSLARAEVGLSGQVPNLEIPGVQAKVDKIWHHETDTYLPGRTPPAAPEIYFSRFVLNDESPEWKAWQRSWIATNTQIWLDWVQFSGMPSQEITQSWINAHIDTVFPFPATFLALHYDGTNKIQINPDATYLRFYQNDPYGMKRDLVGYGFYVTSHEMLHYVLETKGIPGRLHHCLFISQNAQGSSLMADLASYLIKEGISGALIQTVGVQGEMSMMPCEALSAEERAQAKKIMEDGI